VPYADTDFFLAIIKDSDWLKESALKKYSEYRGRIWTSAATLIEIMFFAKKVGLDAEEVVVDALDIAELRGADRSTFLLAAHYVKHKGTNVLDALHAAFCGNDEIISSDAVFDELGLKRIKL